MFVYYDHEVYKSCKYCYALRLVFSPTGFIVEIEKINKKTVSVHFCYSSFVLHRTAVGAVCYRGNTKLLNSNPIVGQIKTEDIHATLKRIVTEVMGIKVIDEVFEGVLSNTTKYTNSRSVYATNEVILVINTMITHTTQRIEDRYYNFDKWKEGLDELFILEKINGKSSLNPKHRMVGKPKLNE